MHQNLPPVPPVPPLPPPLRSNFTVKKTSRLAAGALKKKKKTHPRATSRPTRLPVRQAGLPVGATGVPAARRGGRMPIRRELSAGGVVMRQQGSEWMVALLKTQHKRGPVWVLPKGHVELHTGERVSDAARREVQEEAGLTDLSVKNQLGVTRFKFQAENAVVHKTVHYFLMTTQQKTLTPQAEEGLLDAAWFPVNEALELLAYDTDQDIVQRAWERVAPEQRAARPSRRRTASRPRRRSSRIYT